MGGYLSGTDVAAGLERRVDAERGRWPASVPWPCSQPGFTEPAPLDAAGALLPHLCTLTMLNRALGGMFLWHYPHGFPYWELPSKPGHVGARTFLKRVLFCFQNKTLLRLPPLLLLSIMPIIKKNI